MSLDWKQIKSGVRRFAQALTTNEQIPTPLGYGTPSSSDACSEVSKATVLLTIGITCDQQGYNAEPLFKLAAESIELSAKYTAPTREFGTLLRTARMALANDKVLTARLDTVRDNFCQRSLYWCRFEHSPEVTAMRWMALGDFYAGLHETRATRNVCYEIAANWLSTASDSSPATLWLMQSIESKLRSLNYSLYADQVRLILQKLSVSQRAMWRVASHRQR